MTCHYTPSEEIYAKMLAARQTQAAAAGLGPAYARMAELCAPPEIAELEQACDPKEQERIWALLCQAAQS